MEATLENLQRLTREEKDFFLGQTTWKMPTLAPQSLLEKGILRQGTNHLGIECPVFADQAWEQLIVAAHECDSESLEALRNESHSTEHSELSKLE